MLPPPGGWALFCKPYCSPGHYIYLYVQNVYHVNVQCMNKIINGSNNLQSTMNKDARNRESFTVDEVTFIIDVQRIQYFYSVLSVNVFPATITGICVKI